MKKWNNIKKYCMFLVLTFVGCFVFCENIEATEKVINSCQYVGNYYNGSFASNITIDAYSNGEFGFKSSNSNFQDKVKFVPGSTITVDDFAGSCPSLSILCGGSNGNNYCTIDKANSIPGNSQQGTGSESGNNAEYTCIYRGQINGKIMGISKYAEQWKVTYPDGSVKSFKLDEVGGNLFPSSNCEDIFYGPDKKAIKRVEADTKFTNDYVIQWCNMYDDVEQYCSNGNCEIDNPYCGADVSVEDYGSCPKELRPIIWFVKKVVFNTLKIFVPILLIVMGTIDLIKAMTSNLEKNAQDAVGRFIRRTLTAVLIFFVTMIVSIVVDMFAKTDVGERDDWKACWYNID